MFDKALFGALLLSLVGSCLLTGCASPFERFYKPAATNYGSAVTPPATPVLIQSRDPDSDARQLEQQGYVLIGTASFHAGDEPWYEDEAIAQGKRVGAAVVLLKVDPTFVANHGPSSLTGVPGEPYVPVFSVWGSALTASYWAFANPPGL